MVPSGSMMPSGKRVSMRASRGVRASPALAAAEQRMLWEASQRGSLGAVVRATRENFE